MIKRPRPRHKIRVQSKRRHPMRMLVQAEKLLPHFRVPHLDRPIAARSIQRTLRATAPAPPDDIHARCVAPEREERLAQGGGPDADRAVFGGGREPGVRCISENE
jgi:hypothetical protein